MLSDLHCHTSFSDGLLSPPELVYAAAACGLGQIAVTDHDTVGGCLPALKAAREENLPVTVIPGIELSIEAENDEVHLLGLALEPDNRILNEYLLFLREDRLARVDRTVARLKQLGYPLTKEDVLAAASGGVETLGRPHIAAALVRKGYFTGQAAVFATLLHNGGPAYVPHLKPELAEAIKLVRGAGGLSAVAHPRSISSQDILTEAVRLGVDALEVYYPAHTPENIAHYLTFARNHNLKITGGSDFHGIAGKYPPRLGCYAVSAQMLNLW